jgi:hypothetical protein
MIWEKGMSASQVLEIVERFDRNQVDGKGLFARNQGR